ncbi:MAG TPA: peptidoglycan DD-metalloendopeptidase family protein [Desulfobacterales bacterium]
MNVQIIDLYADRYRRLGWIIFAVFILMVRVPAIYAEGQIAGSSSSSPVCLHYDINCSSYQIIKGFLKPSQNLSEILTAYNITASKIHHVANKSKSIFDVRKMKAGNQYTLMVEPDFKNTARYFIYEKNSTQYVVYDLSDPIDVYQGRKKIEVSTRIATGTVNSSLYKCLTNIGLDTDLLTPLSEIYCWTVDFHHLKKGDHFVVVFKEDYVENKSVGLNKIIAAKFNHSGKDHYAFYFDEQGYEEYYDEKGRSLQRTFLKAPLRYQRITSRPSTGRHHPILKVRRPHLGTDYAAPHGTPIHTIGDGVIETVGYHKELGNHLMIEHNRIYKSQYLHLSRYAKGIRPGVRVKRGDVIGYVGSTGLATGPHLDFRFWKNGKISSHIDANGSEVEALEGEAFNLFHNQISKLKNSLDNPPLTKGVSVAEYIF